MELYAGSLRIAEKLLHMSSNKIDIHMDSEYPFRFACYNGHIDVAKWLINIGKQTNEIINIHAKEEYAFIKSCSKGHLELAKWLYDYAISIGSPIQVDISNSMAFRYCCQNGHKDVAEWLLQIIPNIDVSCDDNYAFKWSSTNGHLEMAQWLLGLIKLKSISSIPMEVDVGDVVMHDLTMSNPAGPTVAKDVTMHNPTVSTVMLPMSMQKNELKNYMYETAFISSCSKGQYHVVDWLYTLYRQDPINYPINIHADNDMAFRYACENGHLGMAQWLYSLDGYIDIHAVNEYAFRMSCQNKHCDIMLWLLELGEINIHVNDEFVFRCLCGMGQIKLAKLLIQISQESNSPINIRACDDYAFRWACWKNNLEVATWLSTFYDMYKIKKTTGRQIEFDILKTNSRNRTSRISSISSTNNISTIQNSKQIQPRMQTDDTMMVNIRERKFDIIPSIRIDEVQDMPIRSHTEHTTLGDMAELRRSPAIKMLLKSISRMSFNFHSEKFLECYMKCSILLRRKDITI